MFVVDRFDDEDEDGFVAGSDIREKRWKTDQVWNLQRLQNIKTSFKGMEKILQDWTDVQEK